MGIDYTQCCIYGLAIRKEDVKTVISPAKYEKQNRYNPKTGKVTHTENTLVKEAEESYSIFGVNEESFHELGWALAKAFPELAVYVPYDEDVIYLGYNVADSEGGGRVTLLRGFICLEELSDLHKQLVCDLKEHETEFGHHDLELRFFSIVG